MTLFRCDACGGNMVVSGPAYSCADCDERWLRDADGVVRYGESSGARREARRRVRPPQEGTGEGRTSEQGYTDWTAVGDLHGKTVVVFGTGRGVPSFIAERAERAVFVDADYERLRTTASALRNCGCENSVAVHAPPMDAPVKRGSVDRIVVGETLTEVAWNGGDGPSKRRQVAFLRRLRGMLGPGGEAYVAVENRYNPSFYRELSACSLVRLLPTAVRTAVQNGSRRRLIGNAGWSLGECRAVLSTAGFRCTDVLFATDYPSLDRVFSDSELLREELAPDVRDLPAGLQPIGTAVLWVTGRFGTFASGFILRARSRDGSP